MEKPPLTAEQKDELARQLQAKLRDERPWTGLRLIVPLVTVFVAGVSLWYFSRTPPTTWPITMACLDDVESLGRPVKARAWLDSVGGTRADAAGLKVLWRRAEDASELPAAKSDAAGIAAVALPAPTEESVLTVQATYFEPQDVDKREDLGRVFVWLPGVQILIVPVAPAEEDRVGTALDPDEDASDEDVEHLKSWKDAGWRIVYATYAGDPATYQRWRDWVKGQGTRGLPDGPVLLAADADLAASLRSELGQRFDPERIRVWDGGAPEEK